VLIEELGDLTDKDRLFVKIMAWSFGAADGAYRCKASDANGGTTVDFQCSFVAKATYPVCHHPRLD